MSESFNKLRVASAQDVFIDVGVTYLSQCLDCDISYPAFGDILFNDSAYWNNIRLVSSQDVHIEYDEVTKSLIFSLVTGS